jgi:hypothetical protein
MYGFRRVRGLAKAPDFGGALAARFVPLFGSLIISLHKN